MTTVQISLRISAQLLEVLRQRAENSGVPVRGLIRAILADYVGDPELARVQPVGYPAGVERDGCRGPAVRKTAKVAKRMSK